MIFCFYQLVEGNRLIVIHGTKKFESKTHDTFFCIDSHCHRKSPLPYIES